MSNGLRLKYYRLTKNMIKPRWTLYCTSLALEFCLFACSCQWQSIISIQAPSVYISSSKFHQFIVWLSQDSIYSVLFTSYNALRQGSYSHWTCDPNTYVHSFFEGHVWIPGRFLHAVLIFIKPFVWYLHKFTINRKYCRQS